MTTANTHKIKSTAMVIANDRPINNGFKILAGGRKYDPSEL